MTFLPMPRKSRGESRKHPFGRETETYVKASGSNLILGRIKLIVSPAEVGECLPIPRHDCRSRAFGECKLPGVVFAKSLSGFAGSSLKFGTFLCMLKADRLRNVTGDEFHSAGCIFVTLQELGYRNA